MFGARYRPALIVGLAAALLNALCGVGAVIYYSTEVFTIAGVQGTTGAEVASLAVGGMNTAAAVAAVGLVTRHGRRPLLSVGLAGIIGSLVVAGAALMAPESSATGIVTVIAILVYMAFFAISAGPLAWLLVAEVFPSRIRAHGAGFATASNWGANLLIALLFPVVAGVPAAPAKVAIIFWFFAACSLGFLVFVRRRVPETKDRTLEQIEQDLRSRSISGSPV
jgi:MFS family permease